MEFQTLQIENKEGYQICRLSNGKGNAINQKMIEELNQYISQFGKNGEQACILTGSGNIFSVGLDIKELISLTDEQIQVFFDSFFDLVIKLVKFPFPLISAINGHSPAGGCVLALCSDYRVMAEDEKFKIGLNELPVGVMATPAIFHLYSFWIGNKNAYHRMLTGALLNPRAAKNSDLIDEIVPQEDVLLTSEMKLKSFLAFDQATWRGMKHNFRLNLVKLMEDDASNGHLRTSDHFTDNDGRGKLQKIVEELARR